MRASKPRSRCGFAILLLSSISLEIAATATDASATFEVTKPKVRVPAPDFSLPLLGGGEFHLADHKGQVVLLNFWATWCTPCRDEMPAMEDLWRRFRDEDLVIVAVSADKGDRKRIAKFVNKLDLSFPVVLDPGGQVRQTYEVVGLPTSYLIGRDGRISGRIIGSRDWDKNAAHALIERLLNKVRER